MVLKEDLRAGDFVWYTLKNTWGKVRKVMDTYAEIELGGTIGMVAFNHLNPIYNTLAEGDIVFYRDKLWKVAYLSEPEFAGRSNSVWLASKESGLLERTGYNEATRVYEMSLDKDTQLQDYCDSIYAEDVPDSPMNKQVGGNHYKGFEIQPLEFIHRNRLNFMQGNIIKYTVRYPFKNGIEDLKKARDYLDKLIACEQAHAE